MFCVFAGRLFVSTLVDPHTVEEHHDNDDHHQWDHQEISPQHLETACRAMFPARLSSRGENAWNILQPGKGWHVESKALPASSWLLKPYSFAKPFSCHPGVGLRWHVSMTMSISMT